MCGRFNQIFIYKEPSLWKQIRDDIKLSHYNIGPGMRAIIQLSEGYEIGIFGMKPKWNPKLFLFNARAEGKGNESNDRNKWEVGINQMPAYRNAIAKRRCIIPVTGFIEGPEKEKLSKPFLISTADERLIFLAGIYEPWVDETTGEEIPSFAIITTPSNDVTLSVGHHRSPLMISQTDMDEWLNSETSSMKINEIIRKAFVEENMKVTPLHPQLVKSGRNHEAEILTPAGDSVLF